MRRNNVARTTGEGVTWDRRAIVCQIALQQIRRAELQVLLESCRQQLGSDRSSAMGRSGSLPISVPR